MASIAAAPLKYRPAIKQLVLLVTVKGKGHTMTIVAQNFFTALWDKPTGFKA